MLPPRDPKLKPMAGDILSRQIGLKSYTRKVTEAVPVRKLKVVRFESVVTIKGIDSKPVSDWTYLGKWQQWACLAQVIQKAEEPVTMSNDFQIIAGAIDRLTAEVKLLRIAADRRLELLEDSNALQQAAMHEAEARQQAFKDAFVEPMTTKLSERIIDKLMTEDAKPE